MNVYKTNGIFTWVYLLLESIRQSITYILYHFYLNLTDGRRNDESRKIPWDEVAPQYQFKSQEIQIPPPGNNCTNSTLQLITKIIVKTCPITRTQDPKVLIICHGEDLKTSFEFASNLEAAQWIHIWNQDRKWKGFSLFSSNDIHRESMISTKSWKV